MISIKSFILMRTDNKMCVSYYNFLMSVIRMSNYKLHEKTFNVRDQMKTAIFWN